MLDRESTFAHPEIVTMLQNRFIPVAIDQAYQRRQKDAEGEFYRKIAGQGPRNNFKGTTQGFYASTSDGKLLFYNNNRNPDRVAGLMKKALLEAGTGSGAGPGVGKVTSFDKRYNPKPPKDGLVIRVRAKILGGYEETEDKWKKIFQTSLSRDNLWVTKAEHEALVRGDVPEKLMHRIARFHLVDNTRGEPPMWQPEEIQSIKMDLKNGELKGNASLRTKSGDREFKCGLFGVVESKNGIVTRFDVIAKGRFQGAGRYTGNPPPGKFPLAISFTLADGSDVADAIPPQGSRGWVDGYIR